MRVHLATACGSANEDAPVANRGIDLGWAMTELSLL
jgi:hypothetical protein